MSVPSTVISIVVAGTVQNVSVWPDGPTPAVKLWEALSHESYGPPIFSSGPEPIEVPVLDVTEHLTGGMIRRTFWRIDGLP